MQRNISKPALKWAITMVLVAFQFLLLGIVGTVLVWLLPTDQFGSVLVIVAGLGILSSLAIGAIIRWLVRD